MADELTLRPLVVDISATTTRLEKALNRIEGQNRSAMSRLQRDADAGMKKFEGALASADRRMAGFGRSLIPSLGALSAALSVREIARYADAWTGAKNSLAVAGVTGQAQVKVLDALYQAAQRNAAPISALASLYGRAAQASDNLGASQSELLRFTGGVVTALRVAGATATSASGALTQLGQLLGSARVMAEEFNSINEGARPILMAVAEGMDEAGGSVSRLKQLATEGKISGQQFFQAFLRSLPEIEKMAANATTTIEQDWTKVNNAMTKYVGETDSSLGASQRLVAGLNSLADNFDATADTALQLASVIAGALVGRSIVGMIATVGKGATALLAFGRALTAVRTAGLATSVAGVGAAIGPIGAVIGGAVVGSLLLFSETSEEASRAARTYADALEAVRSKAQEASGAIDGTTSAIDAKSFNLLTGGIEEGQRKIEEARTAVVDLFREIIDNAPRRLVTDEQLASLEELRTGLETGKTTAADVEQRLFQLANANPKFQQLADQLSPLLSSLRDAAAAVDLLKGRLSESSATPSYREIENAGMDQYWREKKAADDYMTQAERRATLTREQLDLETEIAKVRTDAMKEGVTLTDKQVENLAKTNLAGDKSRSKSPTKDRANDYEQLRQRIEQAMASQIAETAAMRQVNPLVDDFGFAVEKARTEVELLHAAQEAGIPVTGGLIGEISELAEAYARAGAESGQLSDEQDRFRERSEDMKHELEATAKDLAGEFAGMFDGSIKGIDDLVDRVTGFLTRMQSKDLEKGFEHLLNGGSFASLGDAKSGGGMSGLSQLFSNLFGSGMAKAPEFVNTQSRAVAQAAARVSTRPVTTVLNGLAVGINKSATSMTRTMTEYANAIKAIESGGNYGAVGPVTRTGDRAYGAYQVMGANVESWTKELLGFSVSIKDFLNNRSIQDGVFAQQFQKSLTRYGNPLDAASVWYTGRPQSQGANSSDVNGMLGSAYVSAFKTNLGGAKDIPSAVAEGTKSALSDMVGSTGNGPNDPWSGLRTGSAAQSGMPAFGDALGTAASSFGSGYQSQSPGMGALSGALAGLMTGNPVMALVGAIGGECGPIFTQRSSA